MGLKVEVEREASSRNTRRAAEVPWLLWGDASWAGEVAHG